MIKKETIMKALKKVIDPEVGIPITEMKLIDDIKINNGNVVIDFHLTISYCPLASQIALDIKEAASKIKGVKSVKLNLKNHYMSEQINKELNE